MATTLSRQFRIPPYSGATGFTDGAGMSTRIAFEMHYALNNLAGYVNQRVIYAQSATIATPGYVEQQLYSSSREIYMCQFPFVIKPGATRLVWTIGVGGRAAAGTTQITAVTLYVSGNYYAGLGPTSAFQSTLLPTTTTGSRSQTLTISTTTTQYQLADDSTTGFVPPPAALAHPAGDSADFSKAFAIITVTGFGTGAQGFARIHDITLWELYE